MASTFQPDVAELRWTTTTFAGVSQPSRMPTCASIAAIGIPTIPGPTTPIFLICHRTSSRELKVKGMLALHLEVTPAAAAVRNVSWACSGRNRLSSSMKVRCHTSS
jgi:hypothetical protein